VRLREIPAPVVRRHDRGTSVRRAAASGVARATAAANGTPGLAGLLPDGGRGASARAAARHRRRVAPDEWMRIEHPSAPSRAVARAKNLSPSQTWRSEPDCWATSRTRACGLRRPPQQLGAGRPEPLIRSARALRASDSSRPFGHSSNTRWQSGRRQGGDPRERANWTRPVRGRAPRRHARMLMSTACAWSASARSGGPVRSRMPGATRRPGQASISPESAAMGAEPGCGPVHSF
jgi:hypothetical protein